MADEHGSRDTAPDRLPEPRSPRDPGPESAREPERLDRGVESEKPERKVGDKIPGEAESSPPRPGEERSGLLGRARAAWERVWRWG